MKLFTNEAIKKRRKKEKLTKKIINVIITILLIPILIYNVALILQAIINPYKTPSFLGIKTYVIVSGSMIPELNIGDIVIVKNVEENDLKVGDIISFRQGQSVITHRISEIIEEDGKKEYKTKGDNNNTEDLQTITYKTIEGRVIKKISKIGMAVIALQNKMIIIIVAVIIFLYFWQSEKNKSKKERRKIKRLEYEKNRRLE